MCLKYLRLVVSIYFLKIIYIFIKNNSLKNNLDMFKKPFFKTSVEGLKKMSKDVFGFIDFDGEVLVSDIRTMFLQNPEFEKNPYIYEAKSVPMFVNKMIDVAINDNKCFTASIFLVPLEKKLFKSLTGKSKNAQKVLEGIAEGIGFPNAFYQVGISGGRNADDQNEYYLIFAFDFPRFKAFVNGVCESQGINPEDVMFAGGDTMLVKPE